MTGLYYNQEEVFLIFNKDDPVRFYGFVPAIKYDETDPSQPGRYDYLKADFTSVKTLDFKKYFGTMPGIDKTRGETEEFTKRMEERGSYDQ